MARNRFASCIAALREREWTKRELAEHLRVSPRTVKRYLRSIDDAELGLSVREVPNDQNTRYYRLRGW